MQYKLQDIPLYYRTIRHLRKKQLLSRVWYRLFSPLPDTSPPLPTVLPRKDYEVGVVRKPVLIAENSIQLMNKICDISDPNAWNDSQYTPLWLYNLHYFDDLCADDSFSRIGWHKKLIERWIDENPPASGIGWQSYPMSRRLVNWIKAAIWNNLTGPDIQHSIAIQARYLEKRIETHLSGNHVFANAKALIFLGLYFGDRLEARMWLKKGLMLAEREICEQVRGDGSHYEQSPMYHCIFLEDILDIISLLRAYENREEIVFVEAARRMLGFLKAIIHDDGEIALFNDSTKDGAAKPLSLTDYAKRLFIKPEFTGERQGDMAIYRDAGIVRVRNEKALLIADTGPIGPDHNPGHAHADNLTFELSYDKRRVIVDSGMSEYHDAKIRSIQRSTRAHNTVSVDKEDSSEMWATFRVARRAKPLEATRIENHCGHQLVRAGHSGYRRLTNGVDHWRTYEMINEALIIRDDLLGYKKEGRHLFELFLHFHPDILVESSGNGFVLRWSRDGVIFGRLDIIGSKKASLSKSTYHNRLGVSAVRQCLVAHHVGMTPHSFMTTIRWLN